MLRPSALIPEAAEPSLTSPATPPRTSSSYTPPSTPPFIRPEAIAGSNATAALEAISSHSPQ